MWKYIGIKECNDFLLSLNLFNCKDNTKYIRTLYSISNNIEDNYKIFKIKKRNGNYRTIYEPKPLLKHIQKQLVIIEPNSILFFVSFTLNSKIPSLIKNLFFRSSRASFLSPT